MALFLLGRDRQDEAQRFEVVWFRRQPDPGVDHEGAGREEVVSYQSLKDGSDVIDHVQGNSATRGAGVCNNG